MQHIDESLSSRQSGLHILVEGSAISRAVKKLALRINKDYAGKSLLVIGILKGSFIFMADLIRQLKIPVEVDFVQCSSYRSGAQSCGRIKVSKRLRQSIEGRKVLLVEDIIDSGLTAYCILNYLRRKKPASLKLCALADKPSRRKKSVVIDYLGFEVPDKFIVGYGLDWNEKYRNLPDFYILEEAK